MTISEQEITFLSFKITQFIVTFVAIGLEFGQYWTYINITPDSPGFSSANWFVNVPFKIWNITIISLTWIAISIYLYCFQTIYIKGPYISLDLSLAVIWMTSSVAELYPAILNPVNGNYPVQVCSITATSSLSTLCNTWIASVLFCWSNMFIFIMSAFISWRARREKLRKVYSVKPEIKKRFSQRESVLLKKRLENPEQSHPVMLESGIKPLMLVQLSSTS